jgi:thiosulfate/3-mercaptopyruvate sulfurtransferase
MIPVMSAYPRTELVATTGWLEENLERPEVRVVDLRWRPDGTGARLHAASHIPGATWVDWSTSLVDRDAETGVPRLAGPDRVAAVFGAAGVSDGSTVVLYDDTSGLYAGRAWWSLVAYGFESVRILDGGWRTWESEGRPISRRPSLHEPSSFTPRSALRRRLAVSDLRDLLGAPDQTIVDARAEQEYLGAQGTAPRLGHVPGAVNLPVGATVVPGTELLRSADELRALLRPARHGDRIVCYDEAGVGATRLAWVLSVMGHDDVTVLDGGWAEWAARPELPVAG